MILQTGGQASRQNLLHDILKNGCGGDYLIVSFTAVFLGCHATLPPKGGGASRDTPKKRLWETNRMYEARVVGILEGFA